MRDAKTKPQMNRSENDLSGSLDIALNGRFLTRRMSGVDRVAKELLRALSLDPSVAPHLRVMLPKSAEIIEQDADADELAPEIVPGNRATGHMWEQLELPFMTRPQEWLLNLCNTGPVIRSRQAVMIHDAQFITQADAYSWKFRSFYRALMPRLAKRATVLLTVSDFARRELESLGVFPKDKGIVLHNGCDHMLRIEDDVDALSRHNLAPDRYFVVLGNLAAHKNVGMLVEVFKHMNTDLPLVVAGGGSADVFSAVGITESPRVRVLGRVTDAELKTLLSNAKALLFPSKTEGFGLPPLEAMICGCPVVATTGGAVPEVCGDAPLYAHPEKPAEWVAAIIQILENPQVGRDLRARGLRHATRFTWNVAAQKLVSALRNAEARAA